MKIITKKQDLHTQIKHWQSQNQTIAFVPTMGNLHAGHIALVKQAIGSADKVVVSIFVNPTQFDKSEDLQAYPRTREEDQGKLKNTGADLLFLPSVEVMYPNLGQACTIEVPEFSNILEGASRKGHFSGVATVVAKLFNLVQPTTAIFGQKDFQQLMIIRQMVNDLNFNVDIVAAPTIREPDGLAMSSRNGYLNEEERARAASFYQILSTLREDILQGDTNYLSLQKLALRRLEGKGFTPDYIEVRRKSDLQAPQKTSDDLVILGAAWLGKARLIDNISV